MRNVEKYRSIPSKWIQFEQIFSVKWISEYVLNEHKYAKLYCNEQKLWIKINKIKSTN